jgi:hypothetical protein
VSRLSDEHEFGSLPESGRQPCVERPKGTTMRALLTVTAAIEAAAGLALVACPSAMVALLLGSSLDTSAGLTIARVGGAALLSLGVACWRARNDERSRTTRGLIAAMLLYNVAAVAILAHASLGARLSGVGLWPGASLHAGMAIWCTACYWQTRASLESRSV